MLHSKEISVGSFKYVLRSDESEAHLDAVAKLVQTSLESVYKRHPGLTSQNATLLAACHLASQLIRGRDQARSYQAEVLQRAGELLERVEGELQKKHK